VLAIHDGGVSKLPYRRWCFRTHVKGLRAAYFELWKPAGAGSELRLDRAYFTLMQVVGPDKPYRELLGIHCDPDDASRLKKGPHLHVAHAHDPLPHCHFPLNLGHLDSILTDIAELTYAIELALGVVAEDVLPRYQVA